MITSYVKPPNGGFTVKFIQSLSTAEINEYQATFL